MSRMSLRSAFGAALAVILVNLPASALACTACMGDPNSKTAGAINAAIFLMLAFVALMLGSLATFAWYLMRRSATTGAAISPNGMTPESDNPEALS